MIHFNMPPPVQADVAEVALAQQNTISSTRWKNRLSTLTASSEVEPVNALDKLLSSSVADSPELRVQAEANQRDELPLLAPEQSSEEDVGSDDNVDGEELDRSDRPSANDLPNSETEIESVEIDIDADVPDDGLTPEEFANQLRLDADYQEYDPNKQIVTAQGNVRLQLNDALIEADELWVNLVNRYALADGDVLLTRGAQLVRGSRAEYNFIQQSGVINDADGTLFLPAIEEDFRSPLAGPASARRAYNPIDRNAGLQVRSDGSIRIATSSDAFPSASDEGSLRQLRFETDQLVFDVEGWRAEQVRITNDPFSPPELELRTDSLVLRNLSPTQDELLLKRPRLVFDQGFALPLLRSRILLSRGSVDPEDLNPVPAVVGLDGSDRGGLYIGRKVPVYKRNSVDFSVTPQFFVTRAFSDDTSSPFALENFGLSADLEAQLSPRTTLTGTADLTGLNFDEVTENLRTNIRAEQLVGDHRLALQYSYRERLFNGSLGFQDVQSSLGMVLLSPEIDLTGNGLQLTYQAGAQLINAETDRTDLLEASGSDTGRITLGRFQASAALKKRFPLWIGEPLAATPAEGLRFTPQPVIPFLALNTGVRATGTYYTSGDLQEGLIVDVGLEGQLGHFSRNFGDYTRFNIGYSQEFIGGADSPFLFDRDVDQSVLSLGIVQQLYGPFLIGFQTALSFDEGSDIDTVYSLEYSRRTYGILLRYDTAQNTGSIGFRLSNFSWVGDTNPFDTPRVRRVRGGVLQQ